MENSQHAGSKNSEVKCILIVEDDAVLGNILLEALQDEPMYQGLLVSSAERALALLQTITPHLFLLDHRLPGITGLELAYQLRACNKYKQTPVVLMSADLPHRKGDIIEHHFRSLQKPFDLEILLQLIAELLAAS
jgi:DNA-binding response OmpR family regulator